MFTSLNRDKFGVLYYKPFLYKRCGIQKNCWLDGDCSLEDFGFCMHNGFKILKFLKQRTYFVGC